MSARDPSEAASPSNLVRVYVWEAPVRIAHWLIALSILLLSVTGFYIGRPFITVSGPAGQHFVMGWAKAIHGYVAYVLITAVLVRVIWMFIGNKYARWDKFIPVHPSRRRGLWPTLKFYLFALRKPPGFVGHNPLAGATYVLVFGLYFIAIGTGLALRGVSADVHSPLRWVASLAPLIGGLQMVRWIHHVVMWLLLGFSVHHVYSSVLMSTIEANATMESIFSGYKFVPREDLRFSGTGSSTGVVSSMSDRTPLLVLGLGNVLLEDDGVGTAAVTLLRDRYDAPPGVRVLDGGTLGLSLLPYLEEADSVILVDAIRADSPAGSFVRVEGDDVPSAVAARLSPHQVGVADLLDGARWRDRYPARVILLGLVPQSIELGIGLSLPVAKALPDLVTRVVSEATALGFPFRHRDMTRSAHGPVDVGRLAAAME